ncbi:threonine-phosphate decarboxylase CobD [Thauera butanivorans]|uniref:threonine-phosphate decarboxylase CobD n=1 Tax=Thauera butanivorans TaxID=86174 RepID=UPI000839414A|nr:threonine-phosphate decarboxylase CobD [Thauera butanivorans]
MLEHGGRLRRAAQQYGIALDDWLDLSTGINPSVYPVPDIPLSAWHRLPEDDDGLEAAAARYYGSDALLPVAGSQPAIQALPAVLPGRRVSLLAPSYAEHAHAWRGREPRWFGDDIDAAEAAVNASDIVVLVQPNNPTGLLFERGRLLDWRTRLARRGGWLVVDEAFIDTTPEASLVPETGADGLVVLRSLGKFFGLAGARVGFVFAPATVRRQLAEILGPWTVSGPARHAAGAALADTAWQAQARTRLAADGERLAGLLHTAGLGRPGGPSLFKWLPTPRAAELHGALARHGVLVRLFDGEPPGSALPAVPPSLRFGLPPDEAGWQRLGRALRECAPERSTP